MTDQSSAWAAVRGHVPPPPWEVDETFEDFAWEPDHLSHQEFWVVLARDHGNLVALRCWERYEAGESLHIAFADVPEAMTLWIDATTRDMLHKCRAVWKDVWPRLAKIRKDLIEIVSILKRCMLQGQILIDTDESVAIVVDCFMTARGWLPRIVWEVEPTAEDLADSIELVKLAWRVLKLSDEDYDALVVHG